MDEIHFEQPNATLVTTFSSFSNNFTEIENLKEHLIQSLREMYGLMQQQIKVASKSHEHLYYNSPMTDDLSGSPQQPH